MATATEPTEAIAQAVADITEAVKKLRAGRLNDKAIVLLISHASGQPQRVVKAVLEGMEGLRAEFLKKGA